MRRHCKPQNHLCRWSAVACCRHRSTKASVSPMASCFWKTTTVQSHATEATSSALLTMDCIHSMWAGATCLLEWVPGIRKVVIAVIPSSSMKRILIAELWPVQHFLFVMNGLDFRLMPTWQGDPQTLWFLYKLVAYLLFRQGMQVLVWILNVLLARQWDFPDLLAI